MSHVNPIITFKAGRCDVNDMQKPYKIRPEATPGYVYLYPDESELLQFAWRPRSAPAEQPADILTMVPGDGRFFPYEVEKLTNTNGRTNGRIFVLKFTSSSKRYFYWLQSKAQGRTGNPTWFSPRDRKIGEVVDRLLQGEEVNVQQEMSSVVQTDDDRPPRDDGDETMRDAPGEDDNTGPGAGGAGADATGGDVREEGEEARNGGADGARAAAGDVPDAATAVRNFLESLKGGAGVSQAGEVKLYPLLSDLLTPPTTVPMVQDATEEQLDNLLTFLPPAVLILAQQADHGDATAEPTPAAVEAAKQAMSMGQKKALLEKVLRSPQFHQSTASLTMALRDGGLPSIADALSIKVQNGGYVRGGTMPLGGVDAVEAFVEGVKKTVEENKK